MIGKFFAWIKSLFTPRLITSEILLEVAPPQVRKHAPWMEIAKGEIGQVEIAGSGKHNKKIIEYHSTTLLNASADEVPWCSSFVNWVFFKHNVKWARTNSAAAISWLKHGVQIKEPRYGCLMVSKRSGGNHVCFFVASEERLGVPGYLGLGGNQSDSVRISWFATKNLHANGIRWPKEEPLTL